MTKSNATYLKADTVEIDPGKVLARMETLGINKTELGNRSGVGRTMVYRMLKHGYVGAYELSQIAEVLGTTSKALQPNHSYTEPEEPSSSIEPPNNWSIEQFISPNLLSANGVSYGVARLKNLIITGRFSRAKYYDLVRVPPAKREELRERLIRHPTVCTQLRSSSRIAKYIDVRPLTEHTAWWVLDEWIDGINLDDVLAEGVKLSNQDIKQIGSEILLALQTLHSARIVFREMAPERIYVSSDYSACILTDFEMAKLLDSDISVSGRWKLESHYRAPEVGDGEPVFQSDLYSWSKVILDLFARGERVDLAAIDKRVSDRRISMLLDRCADDQVKNRPRSASDVLQEWEKWNVKPASKSEK